MSAQLRAVTAKVHETRNGAAHATQSSTVPHCRLCGCRLEDAGSAAQSTRLCRECRQRPEARRLGVIAAEHARGAARAFTVAEKSMIQKMHGFLPAQQLLDLLNERLAFDLGPDAARYTMEQLHREIAAAESSAVTDGADWAALRKRIAQARRDGVLDAINREVIDDFAVVFSLSPAQVLRLKDVLLGAT